MPEYLSPGVYVEEVPSSIKPIVGVSTSTAAFVGIVKDLVQIPEENPDYDPSKPIDDKTNSPYRVWDWPSPQAALDTAKQAFDKLAQPNVRPARSIDNTPKGLKDFRAAQETLAVAARRAASGTMAPEGQAVLCTTFADFKHSFGDFSMDPDQNNLVHGVFGFSFPTPGPATPGCLGASGLRRQRRGPDLASGTLDAMGQFIRDCEIAVCAAFGQCSRIVPVLGGGQLQQPAQGGCLVLHLDQQLRHVQARQHLRCHRGFLMRGG